MQSQTESKPVPTFIPQNQATTGFKPYPNTNPYYGNPYNQPYPPNFHPQAPLQPQNAPLPSLGKANVPHPVNQGAPAPTSSYQKRERKGLLIVNPQTNTDVLSGEKVVVPAKETPKVEEPAKPAPEPEKPAHEPEKPVETKPAEEPIPATTTTTTEPEKVDEPASLPRNESLQSLPESTTSEQAADEDGEDEQDEEEEEEDDQIDVPAFGSNEKKVYSRDLLLKFKDRASEDTDSVKDQLRSKFPNLFIQTAATAPKVVQPRGRSTGRGGRGRGSDRGGRGGRGGKVKKAAPKQKWVTAANSEDPFAQTYADVTDILNKLTPEMYEKLVKNFVEKVKIPDVEVLTKVIHQVFEKAVREPNFSHVYADLCFDLSQKLNSIEATNANTFKKILLTKCQSEFEQEKMIPEGFENFTPEEKQAHSSKERKRNLGTIVLIGELYKKTMIAEKIIHAVISDLLHLADKSDPEPDQLETLAKLLTTLGSQLDSDKNKGLMNTYFSKLTAISQNKNYHSRIRFGVVDIIELRDQDWVPRVKKDKAKTIKEVRQEAQDEKAIIDQKERKFREREARDRKSGKRDNYKDRKKDGLNIKKFQKDGAPTNLGPTNNKQGSDGSQGWNNKKNDKKDAQVMGKSTNSFSELLTDDAEEPEPEPEQEPEQEKAEPMTAEEVEKKCSTLVGDYLESNDANDCIKDIRSLSGEQATIVQHILFAIASKITNDNHEALATLLAKIVTEQLFASQVVIAGMKALFGNAISTDLFMESPTKYKSIGEVFGRLVTLNVCSLDDIAELIEVTPSETPINVTEFIPAVYIGAKKQGAVDTKTLGNSKLNILRFVDPSKALAVSKFTKMMNAASLQSVEVVAFILDAVATKKSAQDILTFLAPFKADATAEGLEKIFGALVTGIELNSTYNKPASADAALVDTFAPVFEAFAAKLPNQVKLLEALALYGSKSKFDKNIVSELVKQLCTKNIIKAEAMDAYKKSKNALPEMLKKI